MELDCALSFGEVKMHTNKIRIGIANFVQYILVIFDIHYKCCYIFTNRANIPYPRMDIIGYHHKLSVHVTVHLLDKIVHPV
ncbi:hypothetical protein D3C72_1612960 [compost metagenome]